MNITIKDGIVFNGETPIGRIDGGRCILDKRPGPAVYAAINKAHGSKLSFDILPENQPASPSGPEGATGPVGDPGAVGGIGEAGPSGPPEPVAAPPAKMAEPEPKQDPMKGSKDPAWLAWKARQGK